MGTKAAMRVLVLASWAPTSLGYYARPGGFAQSCRQRSMGQAVRASTNGEGMEQRTFELCVVNDDFEIEECEIIERDDLPTILGFEQAAKVLSDPVSHEVIFGKRSSETTECTGTGTGGVAELYTIADWKMCMDEEGCEVPNDVLLKALGPDAPQMIKKAAADTGSMDEATKHQESRFHLHFGAGRLGMGLVVPSIAASGIPFAVVQRPKPKWIKLFESQGEFSAKNELGVSVNSNFVVHNVEVIKSTDGIPNFMPPQSLVFGSTPEDLNEVVERATSFSCSLGAAMSDVLVPVLDELPVVRREQQPNLFCCENDHDAVMQLKERLAGKVFVVDCMVDRVCTGRTITTEGIDVSAEPWRGSIVTLEPDLTGRLPFCSSVVTVPRSKHECEYLSERKFSLVNGMHTVVAFMTLRAEFVDDDDGSREYVLRKYTKMPRDSQRMCEAWRTARAAQLIEKYGVDNLMTWHGVDTAEAAWDVLLEYGDEVLEERFSKTDDVVSRVLGGGVANRWLTRLRPIDTWMEEQLEAGDGDSGSGVSAFMAYAVARDRERAIDRGCRIEDAEWRGCEIEDESDPENGTAPEEIIKTYLATLTRESQRYCTREVQITHKQLVKEQRKAGGKSQAPQVQAAIDNQKGRGI